MNWRIQNDKESVNVDMGKRGYGMRKISGKQWIVVVVMIAVLIGYYVWTAKKETSVESVVIGITYAEEEPSAIIGYDIVHEGDTIHGVKVVKIYRDKVVFEKDGERWTQGVQEKANRAWSKVD